MIDQAETIRQDLARQFYRLLKAAESNNVVRVDFSQLPESWNFAIPHPLTIISDKPPQTVNALKVIENTLPGLWGYAEAAGVQRWESCTRCYKTFDIRTGLEIRNDEL